MRHWRVGTLLGLDKEAVDNFCTVWWSMKPTRDDTVAIDDLVDVIKQLPGFAKKLAKLQEVINEGASRINFQRYCMVMRHPFLIPQASKDHRLAPVPKFLKSPE
ncbi:unnamed protein product [Symbiodinium sp. KB8]|nr:unnamed protein product [Symbiodinium sp. KB8]